MQPLAHAEGIVRFGTFEVELAAGVLRKHGTRLKLQTQPFQVLAALLENPGAVVTRDELRRRLWANDTFVDFEHGMNAAVARLRLALGDSAERPRYVETLAPRIPAPGEAPGLAERFISSTLDDGKARYSPDGNKISFVSSRSGSEEVWISNADGSDPVRLTSFGGPLIGPPAWSPDGQWLAFHARPEGQADLFVMPAAGGTARRLTYHQADETMPNYSRDGRYLYFTSMRSGRQQIWKIPSAGGNAEQVSTGGGMRPIESIDGKTIYYLSDTDGAIRQKSITDGIERQVAAPVCPECGFAVTADGLVYPAPTHGIKCEFRLLTPATGLSRPIVQTAGWTLGKVASVSPDGRRFLFEEAERPGMDLMLVENFRIR